MKTARMLMLAAAAVGAATAANAATIYIDYSDAAVPTAPDSLGRYWNVSDNASLANMVDDGNVATAVDLNVVVGFAGEGGPYAVAQALVDWDDAVTDDNWYIRYNTSAQLRFEGLVAGNLYDVTFYGARGLAAGANRTMEVTIGGTMQSYNAGTEGMTTFYGVAADASGYITVDFSGDGNGAHDYPNLGGMKIADAVALPDPEANAIYIDYSDHLFYPFGHQTTGVDRWWNTSANASVFNMVNASNGTTTVDLIVVGGLDTEGTDGMNSSALVDWGDVATDDNWFFSAAANTAQLRFEGLEAGAPYELVFYGGRGFAGTPRTMEVTIDGLAKSYDSTVEGMVSFNAFADTNGYIAINLEAITVNANLGGIKIRPLALPFPDARADAIYIDYSDVFSYDYGRQISGVDRYWNVSDNASLTNMVSADNSATTVDLVVVDGLDAQGGDGMNSSALVDWGDEVTDDLWHFDTALNTAQLRFEGLEAGDLYEVVFYGGRGVAGTARTMEVTIGGVAKSYNSRVEGMVSFGVVADGSGQITVDLEATEIYANLGGIMIAPVPADPEPDTIYIDYSDALSHAGGHQVSGVERYWNLSDNASLTDMVSGDNSPTTVDLVVVSGFVSEGGDGQNNSALVDWGDEVTDDLWQLPLVGDTAQLRFEGLVAGGLYDLAFYGGRGADGPTTRQMEVVIGGTTNLYYSGQEGMAVFSGVVANGSGQITVDFKANAVWANLGGMKIRPVPLGQPDPEPDAVYVDYSDVFSHAGGHQIHGVDRYWNVSDNANLTNMVNAANGATTVDLNVVSGFDAEGGDGQNWSTLVDWRDEVTDDNWHLDTAGNTAQLRFEGLEAGVLYDVTCYGGRGANPGYREMKVTIGGVDQSYVSGGEGKVTFTSVAADGSGHITVDFEATETLANLGGMKIATTKERPRIVDISLTPGGLVKLIVDVSGGAKSAHVPKATTDLVSVGWGDVEHSDDGTNTFVNGTNLNYSTPDGAYRAIYLQPTEAQKFFKINME